MTEYHASWRPGSYPFARLAFARRGSVLGGVSMWGFQQMKGPSEGLPVAATTHAGAFQDSDEPQRDTEELTAPLYRPRF